ncbi:50S ribosomal protein L1 [Legionella bononiensis]|uniref:Large ribosomal subunit protein uL1 n=1 Tax=Legionella bononiensis TaxID=2793102 RepID=A0ABS1W9I4_9GAMM|nr:50S ribosomal protein L1 [Legionella bononiensis]MBL7480799.1 50S ribosomal protein L1 [Legionella bononiensis]MBL7526018.1 50S ribosomal protein L1 [Legionella bononiensis]MBL7563487.1 50S ribosomal protein L1 [Legionella bononiensis]
MSKLSKKQKKVIEAVKVNHLYTVTDAVALLKQFASTKFRESLDISVNLGVDPRKSDQVVRSSTNLPKGTGKTVRVAVFAQGDNAAKAKAAGADIVGFEDLADQIKAGSMDFDVVIATPDAMRIVGQLGQILGPRGLMPNPKVGTVTTNVEAAVNDAKSGQVRYRTDKNGIIHCSVGKADFAAEDVLENIVALISDLKKAKPASSKGQYLKKVSLSTTMGPGIPIDISSIPV